VAIIDTYYLIDYENVGSNGLSGCKNTTASDHIIIFFTQNAKKIDMAEIANHGKSELKMIEIPAGKQSADIHISSYLGYLSGKSKCSIVIISNDTDFDNVINFWKKALGISISRKKALTPNPPNKQQKQKVTAQPSKESKIRAIIDNKFNRSPYREKKEDIIKLFLNSKDKQTLNIALTKTIPSSNIPALYKELKEIIKDLASNPPKQSKKADKKKCEAQFRSLYGQHFKNGIYKEKREDIIKILLNSTTKHQLNSQLCKIIPNENASKIIRQFQPLIQGLPQ
jgi:hypothetical protein